MKEHKIEGWATGEDGVRRRLSEEEARNLWGDCQRAEAERFNEMPDFDKAINVLHGAKTRLGELGWHDAVYCPKDGTAFAVIEHGSTGIFRAVYSGKWPDGHLLYQDCVGHPKGCMWKPLEKLNDQESERLRLCDESHKKFMEREMVFFGSMTDEAQT